MTPQDRMLVAARSLCDLDLAPTAAALCPTGIRGPDGIAVVGTVAASWFASLSTCEIAARRIVEIAYGLPDPEPYVEQSAPRLLCALVNATPQAPDKPLDASRPSALYRPTFDRPPPIGGGIWYGAANGHGEHVDACVLMVSPALEGMDHEPTIAYSAIAGGQPPAQGQPGSWAVRTVARTLVWDPQREAWRDDATGRVVLCCIDPEALAGMYGGAGDG